MDEPDDMGQRIRAERHRCGLTQDQLADRVGVSRSAVAQSSQEVTANAPGA